jgi:NAD(P)-dependent dehydrogenase (short-subunit alcohol dehydrogenase family)
MVCFRCDQTASLPMGRNIGKPEATGACVPPGQEWAFTHRNDPCRPARPLSLITGASAGIGAAFRPAIGQTWPRSGTHGATVDRLERWPANCVKNTAPRDRAAQRSRRPDSATTALFDALQQRGLQVDWLINNAGYGVPGTFGEQLGDSCRFAASAADRAHRAGHGGCCPACANAAMAGSSTWPRWPGMCPGTAGHTLYAASKAYLIKFSQSLALENQPAGVNVCALCPGFTWSEFHDVTGTRDKMNQMPGFMWLTPRKWCAGH